MEREGIRWMAIRKKGSRRYEGDESVLRLYFGKRVQAVTLRGFLLKIMMAIVSYDLHHYFASY